LRGIPYALFQLVLLNRRSIDADWRYVFLVGEIAGVGGAAVDVGVI
jgi:hypothetical protein